jgi:ketosteroid isomerase-like protein
MIRFAFLLPIALIWSAATQAAPLSAADLATLRQLTQRYVDGWLHNDRSQVMGLLSQDAVFIPHDGVQPHIGYAKIDEFWFPGGKPAGGVTAFAMPITDISGADDHATIYGRSDLLWHNQTQRYRWVGSYLIVARRDAHGWRFTHLMSSDEQPTVEPIGGK